VIFKRRSLVLPFWIHSQSVSDVCVARNVLLFSLILDDADGSNDASIWSIYYNLFLDDVSLNLLDAQARKLYSLAASIQSWHSSKYGKQLRICDQGTLNTVRCLWKSYGLINQSQSGREDVFRNLTAKFQKASDVKAYYSGPIGQSFVLTGTRSVAPIGVCAVEDLPQLHQHYWDHGSTNSVSNIPSESRYPNPMFSTSGTETLHYGTDPLLGFHLATAYIPLIKKSPLRPTNQFPSFFKAVEAAQIQFRSWAVSFRQRNFKNLVLRFFTGDAVTFAYALQQAGIAKTVLANLYRDPYKLEPLTLDSEDYSTTGNAPLSFTVIDTSNLIDHVGAINLLVAVSPLVDNTRSSSVFTESLVKRQESRTAYANSILCGDLPSVSMLLGLLPVEYWTNASATSTADDVMMDFVMESANEERQGQMRVKVTWKRRISETSIKVNERDCAQLLYQVYLNMFQHEDMQHLFSNLNIQTIRNNSVPRYHRGSFALFLRLVRCQVAGDWNKVMEPLLNLIENDSNLLMGRSYIQELYLHLHILNLYSVDTFKRSFIQSRIIPAEGLKAWKNIPAVLCVTLKVPREKLRVLTEIKPTELGTPILHCVIQSSQKSTVGRWQNIFSAIQISFGEISTTGSHNSDAFQVHVIEDQYRWMGSSSIFASFLVPTWMLLLEPETAMIAFGVQSTPQSSRTFMNILGPEMNIYETSLGNKKDVFITKTLPNQSQAVSLCQLPNGNSVDELSSDRTARTVLTGVVNDTSGKIVSLIGRLEILSDNVKSILQGGGQVEAIQTSPCNFAVLVGTGKNAFRISLNFPAPVLRQHQKIRIARKSSYIEIDAPLAGGMDFNLFPEFMYSVFLEMGKPTLWNMTRLNLECLPIIDCSTPMELQWLNTHIAGMFTSRERALRDKSTRTTSASDIRVAYKDGLFSMFMHFTGLQGQRMRLFGLNNPTGGGIHVLIIVSCLRLDITNATTILDAAVLTLTDKLMPQLHSFLAGIVGKKLCSILVDASELRLWKHVLPAMIERCRTWEHRTSCEYVTESRIPISVENGQTSYCSCGNGKLPAGFITGVPNWGTVSNYFVRAAISPCFPAPFVEQVFDFESISKFSGQSSKGCRACGRDKATDGAGLSTCSRCREVKYCSVECQRTGWKEHKKTCKKI
jgi:hypothetical protein